MIRKNIKTVAIPIMALCMLIGPLTGSARAVDVDLGDASGTVGDIVTVAITTGDLTGLDVYSYELTITWNASYATALDAQVTGTITEPWGAVTFNSQPGRVDIAAAGIAPLSGSGTLIEIRLQLGPTGYNTTIYLDEFMFNEGDPPATTTDGYLTISALPTIYIYPNSGEVLVGDSLYFYTTHGTPPYTYGTTDELIGDFAATDYLKGIAPGSVYAFVEDDNGITDTTTDLIYVRAIGLSAGNESGYPGQTINVPISITDPVPYNVKSAEFSLDFNDLYLTAIGTVDAGTVAETAGWLPSVFSITDDRITVSMAGTADLAGPGVLVYIQFLVNYTSYSHGVNLDPADGLFNETYPSLNIQGELYVNAFPAFTIYPDNATIVVGDLVDFYTTGSVTPPLSWGLTNPATGDIDANGDLTALASGTTRVFLVDDIGATDTTGVISICDLYLVVPDVTVHTVFPDAVPITPDRDVDGMDIYSYELIFSFDAADVMVESITTAGTLTESWFTPVINTSNPGELFIAHAGSTPLSGSLPLIIVNFEGIPGQEGQHTNLEITNILFNEGEPCALPLNGELNVVTGTEGVRIPAIRLEQNYPNPFNPWTKIRYSVSENGWARLQVFTPGGRLVTTLADRMHDAGIMYEVNWDGTNSTGDRVASGIYLYLLTDKGRMLSRKMILLR